jgi:hypothetical protein
VFAKQMKNVPAACQKGPPPMQEAKAHKSHPAAAAATSLP